MSASAAGPSSPGAAASIRPGLPHSQELQWASRQLTAIEVNGTFYSTFKPATFARWRDETPDGFVFAIKAHRFTTNRRELGSAREAIDRFLGSGLDELGAKLGPILWQLMPTKAFDAQEIEAFLALLPRSLGRPGAAPRAGGPPSQLRRAGLPGAGAPAWLRHGAHRLAQVPEHRRRQCTVRLPAPDAQPAAAGHRLPDEALDQWAAGARAWIEGSRPRDAFVFFINGAKERAPGAALAFLERLRRPVAA